MLEENFKNELLAFLPKEDVETIEQDVVSIINKFPLDAPKKKNYLNILLNIFMRYRIQNSDVKDIVNLPLLEVGSNPKEVTLKQNKIKINFFEFKNLDKYFTESDLTNLDKYFHAISMNVEDTLRVIDFSRNSLEQRVSQAINDQKEKIFDFDGIFYSYINISLELEKNEMSFPNKKDNDEVLDKIYSMIRFYAWSKSSQTWNQYLSSEREIQSLADHYQSLQWFFDGYMKRSTPFNVHSPKRYGQYIEAVKTGEYKPYKKRIDDVSSFTTVLVNQIKEIYSLLNNSPFSVQKENKSNLFDVFKKVISLQFSQSSTANFTLDGIEQHFKNLKVIFSELDLSLDEFYELNSSNIIDALLVLIVKQIASKSLPVDFPFTLIWESKQKELVEKYLNDYSLSLDGTDLQMFEFLVEYTHEGVTKNNFGSYFKELETIAELQANLLKIGDLEDYEVVKFDDSEYLSSKDDPYDFMDFKKLNDIENNIRQSLNNLKRLWVHDICGDPIFMNDPSFKKFFPLKLGKEKIEYVSELQQYVEKWNDYKQSSEAIKKLQDTIKIVSTIKLKLEGQELVSGDYPGAVSLIKAQKLIARENNRLLLKLKDLISSVVKFKYVDGFTNVMDVKILNNNDDYLIQHSIEIIDKIDSLTQEISSLDITTFDHELNNFGEFIKQLLGREARTAQLRKYSDTLSKRFIKLQSDKIIINTSLHIINLNDSIMNIVSILKETNESLQRFYANSLNKEVFDQIQIMVTSHNLQDIISAMSKVNEQLKTIVENLSLTFGEVATYFDVFADIAFQMMQRYGRLVSKNDFFSKIEKSRINFYEDEGSIVITDKIEVTSSILEKQIFMEKTFSLYTHLSRAFGQINFALNKSFNNLTLVSQLSIDKLERNMETSKKIDVMTRNVDNFYKFLDSIKFPSRKYIQSIKTSLKSIPEVIAPVKANNKLIAELASANKLINALNKYKGTVNYGLLRKLNESLNRIMKFIDSSVLDYFNAISEESKKKEIIDVIRVDNTLESYTKVLTQKINKTRALTALKSEQLLSGSVSSLLEEQKVEVKAETSAETITEEVAEEVVAEAVEEVVEQVAEVVAEELTEEAVAENIADSVSEEEIQEASETIAEEIVEEVIEEATTEQIAKESVAEEIVEEAVTETVAEEQDEELANESALQEEPEVNQLEESEDLSDVDLEDSYEPEISETADNDNDSDDLISEMEKLLNVDSDKKNKDEET